MGYIPPIKDEQSSIYANRQSAELPTISAPSPAEGIDFFDALNQESNKSFERDSSKQRLLEIAKQHEKAYSGKGKIFDKSI